MGQALLTSQDLPNASLDQASWALCAGASFCSCATRQADAASQPCIDAVHPATSAARSHREKGPLWPVLTVAASHSMRVFSDCYVVGKILGRGTFSQVFQALTVDQRMQVQSQPEWASWSSGRRSPRQSRNQSSPRAAIRSVAAKMYKHSQTSSEMELGKNTCYEMKDFNNEQSLLCRLRHPHIAKMFETFRGSKEMWVVLEHCAGGELHGLLARKKADDAGLDEGFARHLFCQMLHVVAYLHAQDIVHRDLKCENFLLLGPENSLDCAFVKLCDFGSAAQLTSEMARARGRVGTLSYTAPEVYEGLGANIFADCWSLGVVLYTMLCALSPFRELGEESQELAVSRIRQGKFIKARASWMSLSKSAQDLIQSFLKVSETDRLLTTQAMKHSWMHEEGTQFQPQEESRVLRADGAHANALQGFRRYGASLLQFVNSWSRLDMLQRVVLGFCALAMPEVELRTLEKDSLPWYSIFFAADDDKDGKLSHEELMKGLTNICDMQLKMRESDMAELLHIIKSMDMAQTGYVDWGDWSAVALLSDTNLSERDELLQTVFRMLDSPSADGRLSADDLLKIFERSSGEVASEIWSKVPEVQQLLSRWAPKNRQPPYLRYEDVKWLVSSFQVSQALAKADHVLDMHGDSFDTEIDA
eukprot:TRINITY_DN42190_c0_g1_i1.p1 TRINITY_DN42190_c0_g1~~TRINITY_DN42190_c0_g1_i1.p1  ORF type:complete len:647 (-),score=115.18 TRINITY_DN42190_c0_g1_i1:38-1978(-)